VRRFNTTGPCNPEHHYMVPVESRLPEMRRLVHGGDYFVLHAPRQTGKTTLLRALALELTAGGRHAALHFSGEMGEPMGDDYGAAERVVWASLEFSSKDLPPELRPPPRLDAPPGSLFQVNLAAWAESCPRPVVLFFDEIDALLGESLRSVLRQLRAGFTRRPDHFPASVVLCGLRDVRDYKVAAGGGPVRLGSSSPFNVKMKSLRIGDFSEEEVRSLYGQHTAQTGQRFTEEALALAWELGAGQPWLTNALAREVVEEMAVPLDEPITTDHLDEAKEALILARQTHLDSLAARLHEPRVKRVIEPLIAGELVLADATYQEDFSYVRDLGLVAPDLPPRIANPIYREVIVRVLAFTAEANVLVEPASFVLPDGRLDLHRLLEEFADFWKEHGDILAGALVYHEVAPQLVLMGFLHRVVNGGGYIDREYGVGRGRIDLLVRWPYPDTDGLRAWQREALELKVRADGRPDPLERGLVQLDGYLERLGLERGVLVIFDRRQDAPPIEERTRFEEAVTPTGRAVTVLRL
jgi:hypothetical protein